MRRKKSQAPFSLFAFQDAISSVCGLVVLITLILALELTKKIVEEATEPPVAETDVKKLNAEIATLKSNLATLEETTENWNATARQASRSQFSVSNAESKLRDAQKLLDETIVENERLQQLAADVATSARLDEFAARVQEQKNELAQIDAEIAKREAVAQTPLSASVFYSTTSSIRETPWIVEVAKGRIVARSLASTGATSGEVNEFSARNFQSAFLTWARQRDQKTEYFVLLFRPSGVSMHDDLRNSLETAGYKIGVDLVGETQTIEIYR